MRKNRSFARWIYLPATSGTRKRQPRVAVGLPVTESASPEAIIKRVAQVQMRQRDAQIEYWIHPINDAESLSQLRVLQDAWIGVVKGFVLDMKDISILPELSSQIAGDSHFDWIINLPASEIRLIEELKSGTNRVSVCADFANLPSAEVKAISQQTDGIADLVTLSAPLKGLTAIGSYRTLVAISATGHSKPPQLWLRNTNDSFVDDKLPGYTSLLMECSILSGSMLCEGHGNLISVEDESNLLKATALAYNILQGARARISKTEFVACPSCGRTLFDLQSTTQKIRSRTAHLKGGNHCNHGLYRQWTWRNGGCRFRIRRWSARQSKSLRRKELRQCRDSRDRGCRCPRCTDSGAREMGRTRTRP